MTYSNRKLIAQLFAGLLAATAATQAPAQTVRVAYRPSELSTSAGTQAVYDRIKASARKACSDGVYLSTSNRCRRELVGMVVAKINNPAMIALHGGKATTRLASR